jgi:hypothetical protein
MLDSDPYVGKEDPMIRAACSMWLDKIKHARDHKRKVFQEDADRCMQFFNGPKNWDELMGSPRGAHQSASELPDPIFKISVNKVFEFVTIFGPAMYYQNPVRTVNPREPVPIPPEAFPDPYTAQAVMQQEMIQQGMNKFRSALIVAYLNWLVLENRLDVESRQAIEEALIKGRGCLWTELRVPPGTDYRIVVSVFDTVDHLMIDPDAPSPERATWIARKCIEPVWQVERDHGLEPGTLRGNLETQAMQASVNNDDDKLYDRKKGATNDLLVYWKVYSKMGIGGRLKGIDKDYRGPLDLFGDYCYLVLAEGVPYPLNLPPAVQMEADPEEVFGRVAWPTPFWADDDWPVTLLDFHRVPNSPWPMSHIKAGLGELTFLNWVTSFLAGKLRNTTRDFIAVLKEAGEEIKTQILEGRDLTMLDVDGSGGKHIDEVVKFLQHPSVNGDVWKFIELIDQNVNKRLGLNELLYGSQGATQIRSASEFEGRTQNSNVRPEDMAKQVEAWMSAVAAKEAVCARFHLHAPDILPALGPAAAGFWDQFVYTQDLSTATRQLDYQIEAGSTRRPNKDTERARTTEGVQVLLPVLMQYAQGTGDLMPLNNLLTDWAKARDLPADRYALRIAPPPPAPPAPAKPADEGSRPSAPPSAG